MDDPHPEDVFELAKQILYARERSWSPTEYGSQPAVFVQAFELFLPAVVRLVEEARERMRHEKDLTSGGNQIYPGDRPQVR